MKEATDPTNQSADETAFWARAEREYAAREVNISGEGRDLKGSVAKATGSAEGNEAGSRPSPVQTPADLERLGMVMREAAADIQGGRTFLPGMAKS